MAVPFDPTAPTHQRLDELAALLAIGLRRAFSARVPRLPAPSNPITETAPDSPRDGLDVSPRKSVHGPRG